MYSAPPQSQSGSVNIVAGIAQGSVIAAPGAGNALRLVGGQLSITRLAGGLADIRLLDASSGTIIALAEGLGVAGTSTVPLVIPEPGIQLDINHGIDIWVNGAAAGGAAQCVLYYFEDILS